MSECFCSCGKNIVHDMNKRIELLEETVLLLVTDLRNREKEKYYKSKFRG